MKINKYNRAAENTASKRQFNSLTEVTPSEKEQIKDAFFKNMFEKITLSGAADIYKIDSSAYTSAYSAMKSLVSMIISDMKHSSYLDEREYFNVFNAFYKEREKLYDLINAVSPIQYNRIYIEDKIIDKCSKRLLQHNHEADSDKTEGKGCLLWFLGGGIILYVIIHFANILNF